MTNEPQVMKKSTHYEANGEELVPKTDLRKINSLSPPEGNEAAFKK